MFNSLFLILRIESENGYRDQENIKESIKNDENKILNMDFISLT